MDQLLPVIDDLCKQFGVTLNSAVLSMLKESFLNHRTVRIRWDGVVARLRFRAGPD